MMHFGSYAYKLLIYIQVSHTKLLIVIKT